MRLTSVVIEIKGNKPIGPEEAMIAQEATRLGLIVHKASLSQLQRDRFRLHEGMMAVGTAPFIKQALRQRGVEMPLHTPYPEVLRHLLYREVKRLPALRDAKSMLMRGIRLFVKPEAWKRFTGFVAEFEDDYRFGGASSSMPVWVSTPVKFLSEWRVYVADDVILDVRFADHGGDRKILPDMIVITDAILEMAKAGAPRGYVIDFGVLDTGHTALIELNDGFSFGAYDGLPAETLWVVMLNRWMELIKGKK